MHLNLLVHKRDERILFDEKPHIYYVDGKPYELSVTAFIHQFFDSFDAQKIIEKYYSMWQTNPNSPYYGLYPEEIIEKWNETKEEASMQGTRLHKNIEKFYRGETVEDSSPEFQHFLDFFKDNKHLEPIRQEWTIFDEELEIAGSVDALFSESGDLIIIDWKRSKAIKEQAKDTGYYPVNHLPNANYWHYALQLNVYKAILEKKYDVEIKYLKLAVFHPNNDSYDFLRIPDLQDEVNKMFYLRKKELELLKQ